LAEPRWVAWTTTFQLVIEDFVHRLAQVVIQIDAETATNLLADFRQVTPLDGINAFIGHPKNLVDTGVQPAGDGRDDPSLDSFTLR
jgi:hypothetical protein